MVVTGPVLATITNLASNFHANWPQQIPFPSTGKSLEHGRLLIAIVDCNSFSLDGWWVEDRVNIRCGESCLFGASYSKEGIRAYIWVHDWFGMLVQNESGSGGTKGTYAKVTFKVNYLVPVNYGNFLSACHGAPTSSFEQWPEDLSYPGVAAPGRRHFVWREWSRTPPPKGHGENHSRRSELGLYVVATQVMVGAAKDEMPIG